MIGLACSVVGLKSGSVMNDRKLFRFAVDLFIENLQRVTHRAKVNYRCNDTDVKGWEYFRTVYPEVGEEFIRDYVAYGMHSWFGKDMEGDFSRTIRFHWIFGKMGVKRYNMVKKGAQQWCVRVGGLKNTLVKRKSDSKMAEMLRSVREDEERFKREFLNTARGLLWCVANTTLYNHRSGVCVVCGNKDACRELLRTTMSNVYRIRGYETEKRK